MYKHQQGMYKLRMGERFKLSGITAPLPAFGLHSEGI
jgi:hypothetical protein